MTYESRAVRSLSELHEQELRRFLNVWERFTAAGRSLPEARGDPDYQDPEHLASHVLKAAQGYLSWVGEQLGRPITELERSSDPYALARRLQQAVEAILAAYHRHLALVRDEDLNQVRPTQWGFDLPVESMLEHAVVHPMRHRIQLERILEGRE